MSVVGFIVIAFMIAVYVMLDGYDLGVATIAPLISRTDRERSAAMESIGPFWNGNEVWLVAGGAALFALFPVAYASSFSGFYLPFIVVLWLLMFRGIALELRDHLDSDLWHQFWDAAFTISSALLIIVFGVALGNLIRGVPLDASGYFQGTFGFLLNPYALVVGIFALVALAQHGATFILLRIAGQPAVRAKQMLGWLWWAVLICYFAVTGFTAFVRGTASLTPFLVIMPILSLLALIGLRIALSRGVASLAFAASSAFVVTLLVASAGTLFPYLLPAYPARNGGISIYDASPNPVALTCALTVTIVGIVVVLLYSAYVWRRMAGRIVVE
jgi:cytochrome bd ubiquinol oxidase subunit II